MKIAQSNAALPKKQGGLGLTPGNTACQRAETMGFWVDKPLYHGTACDFGAFDPEELEKTSRLRTSQEGVATALDPRIPNDFSQMAAKTAGNGQRILPLLHRSKRNVNMTLESHFKD